MTLVAASNNDNASPAAAGGGGGGAAVAGGAAPSPLLAGIQPPRQVVPPLTEELNGHMLSFLFTPPSTSLFSSSEGAAEAAAGSFIRDLSSAELTCREFRKHTERFWNDLAYREFGLVGGKKAWMKGASLLRKPMAVFEVEPVSGDRVGVHQPGVASGINIFATRCHKSVPSGGRGLVDIRDARTLAPIRTDMTDRGTISDVAVCGQAGEEVVVTSNWFGVIAYRGNRRQILEDRIDPSRGGWRILGCETHLVVIKDTMMDLYKIAEATAAGPMEPGELLTLQRSVLIPGGGGNGHCHPHWKSEDLSRIDGSRNCDRFVIDTENGNTIIVWELDKKDSTVEIVKSFDWGLGYQVRSVVLGERYIAASYQAGLIHIYDAATGSLLHRDLCDVPENQRLNPVARWLLPVAMTIVGDLLISASHLGAAALCIWNMRTGCLLRRHDDMYRMGIDVNDLRFVYEIVQLRHLPAFVVVIGSGRLLVWGTPHDSEGRDAIQIVQQQWQQEPRRHTRRGPQVEGEAGEVTCLCSPGCVIM